MGGFIYIIAVKMTTFRFPHPETIPGIGMPISGCLLIFILLLPGCTDKATAPELNRPRVDSITIAPDFILPGGTLELAAFASDPENDSLRYRWITYPRVGLFENDSLPNTRFTFADYLRSGMSVRFTLTVYDGKDSTSADRWVTIDTGKSISGHVFFEGTKVPIPGASLAIGSRADTSDSEGAYGFFDLYTGNYTLTAVRDGFDPVTVDFELTDNLNADIFLTSPAYSGDISGIVSTKEGTLLENVRVTLLNPDGTNSQIFALTASDGSYTLPAVPNGNRRLLIEDGGNGDYDILVEVRDVLLMGPSLNCNIIAKVRRIAFLSQGGQTPYLWDLATDGSFTPWFIDADNDCLRFDFCVAEDLGRLAMKSAVPIPRNAGAVYWAFDIELTEAACEVIVYVDGVLSSGGIYWGGTRHYNIHEPIRIPTDYQAGHNLLVEFYAWPLRTGICGDVKLHQFRIDYLE